MEQEKKTLSFILLLLAAVFALICAGQWMEVNHIHMGGALKALMLKFHKRAMLIRLIYVVVVILAVYLIPSKIKKDDKIINSLIISMFVLGTFVVLGFSPSYIYNLLIYPVIFIGFVPVTVYAISMLRGRKLKNDDSIFGISNEKSEFYFTLETADGDLTIHKPQQNIYIEGGPGSGKSESFIKGMIYQCAERNYAGFIYDWEGDPNKHGSPILSKIAYGSVEHFKKKGTTNLNFAFINFTDMMRTARVNIFSEKYVPKGSESLFIRNIAVTLMKNLEPAWKEKTDFWANNAINYVYSIATKCYKERDRGINTLPHVIAFALSDSDAVFEWLAEDPEIALNMSSMLTAHKLGATQQTAGAVSSAQTPLVTLNNKYIFWVLSPKPEEELSLDITNPEHPTLLCVGNAPSIKEAVSPPISCIASVIMFMMNNPGKVKSVFMVDEFPTVLLQGIDVFIGTARKHNVATILAVQDFEQAVRDYGEKSANILKASCGSQAFGMTGNDKTARNIESLFGEIKEVQESHTEQDSGGGSRSESLQKEKILKARDVAGQKAGHFVGKVANGVPAFFSTQFNLCEYKEMEIPEFSKRVNIGDSPEDKQAENEIMEEIVQTNYENIIQMCNDVLKPFKKK